MMGKEHWDRVKTRTLDGKVAARISRLYEKSDPVKIIIYNNLCPGDLLVMTASLEAIHSQYPGQFITDIRCWHPSIFDNNPHVTPLQDDDPDAVHLWTTYPLINKSNQRPVHFLEGYLDWFRNQLDIDLILESTTPHIYLSEEEKKRPSIIEEMTGNSKYWIVNAGWKNDYTIKRWATHYWQEVVNHFKGKITFAQIGLNKPGHNHPLLENVINLVDKTNIRELILTCSKAQGGIGTITCIQHMFAGFKKPYVVTHGGREPPAWTQYSTQRTLSNIGCLKCNETQACWRSRIVPLNDDDKKDKRLCSMPMIDDDCNPIAQCMWNIKPEQVIKAIEGWYEGGVLTYG